MANRELGGCGCSSPASSGGVGDGDAGMLMEAFNTRTHAVMWGTTRARMAVTRAVRGVSLA